MEKHKVFLEEDQQTEEIHLTIMYDKETHQILTSETHAPANIIIYQLLKLMVTFSVYLEMFEVIVFRIVSKK